MIWSDIVNGKPVTDNTTMSSTSTSKDFNKTSTLDVNDFLNLLVTEMQYQDPLEPTDNSQYIAQMATFTQVEATNEMVGKVSRQMACSLVGQTVIMNTDLNSDGYVAGAVDYWEDISGTIYLGIEGKLYDIADLDSVIDEKYYNEFIKGDK